MQKEFASPLIPVDPRICHQETAARTPTPKGSALLLQAASQPPAESAIPCDNKARSLTGRGTHVSRRRPSCYFCGLPRKFLSERVLEHRCL